MKRIWVGTAAALALAGCHGGSGAGGGVRGRVIGMNGQPVANAQVMLDHAGGRTTKTNSLGEFHLTSPAGAHHVLAHSAVLDAAASVAVNVAANGEQNVGDVGLVDCTVILAGGSTGPGDPNGGGTADGSGDPNTEPPCQIDPPPPPPDSIHYDSITANDAFGFVDGAGIYGSGYDEGHQVGFDFYIAGDFTSGGSKTVHVDGTQAGPAAAEGSMDLYVFDPNSGWGWFYVLRTGDLTVNVTVPSTPPSPTPGPTAVPGGDPSGGNGGTGPDGAPGCGGAVVHFDFKGENLLLDYVSWDGTAGGQVATVDEATASGDAWVFLPPPPPPGDITIADFVADWKDIYLCPGCGMDGGDALYVYAFDSTDNADLSLYLPVSSLALPGTVTISASATAVAGGMADVYDPSSGASWSYSLDHADLTSSSTAVTSGEELNLVLSASQFDWMGSNGVVVGGNGGVGTSPGGVVVNAAQTDPPTPAELHLFITHADLSAVVDGLVVDPPPPPDGGNGGTNTPLAAR